MTPEPDAREVEQAVRLFRDFQKREPSRGDIVQLNGTGPLVALRVGIALSIGYKASGDGEKYFHEFEGNKPGLFVNAQGNQIYFEGGIYRFTRNGFVK